jgi:diacylglycerol O-acyltransferase
MLGALVDLEPNPSVRLGSLMSDPVSSSKGRPSRRAVRAALANPVRSAKSALRMVVSAARVVMPNRRPLSRVMRGRSGHFSLHTRSVPLAALRATSKEAGGTLNDGFIAVVLDAIERYHHVEGSAGGRVRVHMPINIRNDITATAAGNQFVPARVVMPLDGSFLHQRIANVRRQLTAVRAEPALPHINTVSAMVQRLGERASRWVIGGMMKGVDVLASNVPGPQCPLYVAGVRINEFYAFGPPAGAALNVTLFTFDGHASLGVTIDTKSIPVPDRFMRCLDESLAWFSMSDAEQRQYTQQQRA